MVKKSQETGLMVVYIVMYYTDIFDKSIFHWLGPLGQVRHRVAMSMFLFICPLPAYFFWRTLIEPKITWSVQGLTLVNQTRPPSPTCGPNLWTRLVDQTHGPDLWTWLIDPTHRPNLWTWLMDLTHGPYLWTLFMDLTCGTHSWSLKNKELFRTGLIDGPWVGGV